MFAKAVGDDGIVWAFEPAQNTADYLRCSITENQFKNIKLFQEALSNRPGESRFFISNNSELNSLTRHVVHEGEYETVLVKTLDHCFQAYQLNDIDFLKMDAEGEEVNILKKGKEFFEKNSPLVMFELKHLDSVNSSLIARFEMLGYSVFRLIPGRNVLVPFSSECPFDGYLLNLFACRKEKLNHLISDRVVSNAWNEQFNDDSNIIIDFFKSATLSSSLEMPEDGSDNVNQNSYKRILSTYLASKKAEISKEKQIGYLMWSLKAAMVSYQAGETKIERLFTFSRIAFDAGERQLGGEILKKIIHCYNEKLKIEIKEWCLPAMEKYEQYNANGKIKELFYASALEQYIHKHVFSAYFSSKECLNLFQELSDTGFMDKQMYERYKVVRQRF